MATVGQRIKSAQARAGLSVTQIAAENGRPARFSAKTIGRVIRGERDLEPHEADWLAKVLNVPVESFYEDPPAPSAGQDAVMDRLDAIDHRLANLEEMVTRGLDQLGQALSASAVEQADRIVQGIVADFRSGKLTVPPPTSKPKAPKRAPKSSRVA